MSKQHKKAIHRRKKQIANKYIKNSTSNRGMKIKSTVKHNFMPILLAKVGKSDKTKCGKDMKE